MRRGSSEESVDELTLARADGTYAKVEHAVRSGAFDVAEAALSRGPTAASRTAARKAHAVLSEGGGTSGLQRGGTSGLQPPR